MEDLTTYIANPPSSEEHGIHAIEAMRAEADKIGRRAASNEAVLARVRTSEATRTVEVKS